MSIKLICNDRRSLEISPDIYNSTILKLFITENLDNDDPSIEMHFDISIIKNIIEYIQWKKDKNEVTEIDELEKVYFEYWIKNTELFYKHDINDIINCANYLGIDFLLEKIGSYLIISEMTKTYESMFSYNHDFIFKYVLPHISLEDLVCLYNKPCESKTVNITKELEEIIIKKYKEAIKENILNNFQIVGIIQSCVGIYRLIDDSIKIVPKIPLDIIIKVLKNICEDEPRIDINIRQDDFSFCNPWGTHVIHDYGIPKNEYISSFTKDSGYSPTFVAINKKNSKVLKILLELGASIDFRTNNKSTLLHYAAHQQSIECMEILLSSGADIRLLNNNNFTVLHSLMYSGIERERKDYHSEKLRKYRNYPSEKLIKYIIDKGVDINARDNHGHTALHMVIYANNDIISIMLLLKFGADITIVNNRKETTLHLMIRYRNNKMQFLKCLCDSFFKDIDINSTDIDGNTPLHLEMLFGYAINVQFLLEKGADPTIYNNKGLLPIHNAIFHHTLEFFPKVELLNHITPLNTLTKNGQNVIHLLLDIDGGDFSIDDCEILKNLVFVKNIDVNVIDNDGNTALHLLTHVLCSNDNIDIIKYHIPETKFNYNIQNKIGDTPLHNALKYVIESIYEYVVFDEILTIFAERTDVTIRNNKGESCIDLMQQIVKLNPSINIFTEYI